MVYVKGRQHPVQVFHTATGQSDYLDAALRTFFQIHIDNKAGDVLIFLPGRNPTLFISPCANFTKGQEDIESLDKSIMLYASQLPKNALTVSMVIDFAQTSLILLGDDMSNVLCPSAGTAGQDICSNPCQFTKVHPSYKYCGDFDNGTWH